MILHLPMQVLVVLVPLLLFSLVIHEYAHARTAWQFGDGTAKAMGRLTLNPLAHLDPIGTHRPAAGRVRLGQARAGQPLQPPPAKVGRHRREPGRAGQQPHAGDPQPAFASRLDCISSVTCRFPIGVYEMVFRALAWLAMINIALFAFNLIPLFPLDGHHILRELLPVRNHQDFMMWQMKYGRIALMALVFGPGLVATLTNNPAFPDPINWLFSHAQGIIFQVMGMG